jgi:hypothetical protein
MLRRRIQVLEQAQNGALTPLKTKASRRTVPVGNWVIEEIAAHLQRFGAEELGTGGPGDRKGAGQSIGGGRVGL